MLLIYLFGFYLVFFLFLFYFVFSMTYQLFGDSPARPILPQNRKFKFIFLPETYIVCWFVVCFKMLRLKC